MSPLDLGSGSLLYQGDAGSVLRELPAESVDTCVTSPPYWGLRDYGTATWIGGDAECVHGPRVVSSANKGNVREILDGDRARCARCDAIRVDAQLGLEPTPELYVSALVGIMREVRRVLRPHGTLWLNLGDSYAGGSQTGRNDEGPITNRPGGTVRGGLRTRIERSDGLKPKDLVGIPWRVAFALQADGWYLRSDIVWSKPNAMPESIRDRPTKAHEYVFLLAKSERYFFDQEAAREPALTAGAPHTPGPNSRLFVDRDPAHLENGGKQARWPGIGPQHAAVRDRNEDYAAGMQMHDGRNIRSVWTIVTSPYPDAHFATFPRELPERCIKAGCPEQVCSACGRARTRIVDYGPNRHPGDSGSNEVQGEAQRGYREDGIAIGTVMRERFQAREEPRTVGYTDCGHDSYVPGTVLDPFAGSGTTLAVARDLARRSIGVELNPEYVRLIERRMSQVGLFV